MMYKILIFITMMAVSTFAFAGISVNTNGLSEEQKAALILQVEDMKKTPPQPGEVIESMKKWSELGQIPTEISALLRMALTLILNRPQETWIA